MSRQGSGAITILLSGNWPSVVVFLAITEHEQHWVASEGETFRQLKLIRNPHLPQDHRGAVRTKSGGGVGGKHC